MPADIHVEAVAVNNQGETMCITRDGALRALADHPEQCDCGCGAKAGLIVGGRCHPQAPVFVTVHRDDNREPLCLVRCAECGTTVAEIVLGFEQ